MNDRCKTTWPDCDFADTCSFPENQKKKHKLRRKILEGKKKAFFVRNDHKNLDGVLYVEMFLNNTFLDPENLSIPDLTWRPSWRWCLDP